LPLKAILTQHKAYEPLSLFLCSAHSTKIKQIMATIQWK
jgi:hypothetical protein